MRLLVVNAGSSSLKLSVLGEGDELLAADDSGDLEAFVTGAGSVDAVGHRVVHGGTRFTGPVVIDATVRAALGELAALAPLHQGPALAAIDTVAALLPGVPAVACFDTAFHSAMPPSSATYPLPAAWVARWGLRRFGFHGLSHAWAARRGLELAGLGPQARVVICHLGAGSSCCAVAEGRSVDTTMGFTPLDGLVMATRSGSVDPGLVLWLVQQGGLPVGEVLDGLEHASGLAALAGGTGDMRDVVAAAPSDPLAQLALDVWVHRLRQGIAAMTAALGGLDLLVFTGGIGEHQPGLRSRVCESLSWLGIGSDETRNAAAAGDAVVSPPGAAVVVAVVTAREDRQMAVEIRTLLRA